jgi:hypothetical protein
MSVRGFLWAVDWEALVFGFGARLDAAADELF